MSGQDLNEVRLQGTRDPYWREIWREASYGERWRYVLGAVVIIWILSDKVVLNNGF